MSFNKISRRQLLRGTVGGVVAIQAISLRSAWADDALKEDDPLGKALAYKIDASTVSADEFPTYKPDQTCANCAQFQAKEEQTAGGCAIFPGKTVEAAGWCKVWVQG